ncbi:threonine--tRNA ligase [Candidatus Micrarchaeota archaeon]|nr:threonine--tRNA ligase [Candidatus Micrarchaeota archaeon]
MRILELHCDYVKVKPKQKALKTVADLTEAEKAGLHLENVLVVFSSFEQGDDAVVVDQAVAAVQKNFGEIKATTILVYPYAHLSSSLAKPAVAINLLDSFLEKVRVFCPNAQKSVFGYYKEFELKCKGHPLAELSKTFGTASLSASPQSASVGFAGSPGAALEKKVAELGGKGANLFSAPSVFADYGAASVANVKPSHTLEAQRNTAALLLAHAVSTELGGSALCGFGKDAEIYVDFDSKPVNSEILDVLDLRMDALRKKDVAIKVHALDKKAAEKHLSSLQKEALADTTAEKVLMAELEGKWFWLPGPFCESSGKAEAFALTRFGGSYWKNNSANKALQRIHLSAFGTAKERAAFLELQKEAEARDHRKLGKQLDLFSIHEEGVGFIFYHPNGMVLYKELEKLLREQYEQRDYLEIKTPMILNEDLWHRSGHWDHYQENMYFTQIDGVPHAIKPMNCPGSILIYKTKPRSYRELPLRLAENGIDHRHELSGVLSGLFRVRAFTQDDAHLYVTEEQILDEVTRFIQFLDFMYSTFGFTYQIALSTRPAKAMGSVAFWEKAETALKEALRKNKKEFTINEGDGAFYGPKIDFRIQDALGRQWQCGTMQLDLQMPERFDLNYEGSDGKRHRPVMLHRVIYGSFERFLGILIEHFAGAFPTWLAPTQVMVLPLTDNENDYAEKVAQQLKQSGVRVKSDLKSGKLEGKIRDAQIAKIPYMLVVGQKERDAGTVSVRRRDGVVKHGVKLAAFEKTVIQEIKERRLYG